MNTREREAWDSVLGRWEKIAGGDAEELMTGECEFCKNYICDDVDHANNMCPLSYDDSGTIICGDLFNTLQHIVNSYKPQKLAVFDSDYIRITKRILELLQKCAQKRGYYE